jgi:hypothetical protein
MVTTAVLDEYMAETRNQLCNFCVSRRTGAHPASRRGSTAASEHHLAQLIEICRSVDSPLIDPYVDRLRDEICADCAFRERPECPCPLKYLLPLAVGAVEIVEERRRLLGDRMAWPYDEMPETD